MILPPHSLMLTLFARLLRTLLAALFFVALIGNLLPEVPEGAREFEVVEVRR